MLIVGPIGARPWLTMDELVASLEALGESVVVNGTPREVLPLPPGWRPGTVRWAADWLRWRRRARRSLTRAEVSRILVWDPVVTLLCRAARPRGIEIIWVPPPRPASRRERLACAAAARCGARVASAPPVLPGTALPLREGWVVFGGPAQPDDAALDELRRRAADSPALALIFDARALETTTPDVVAALVDAAQPRHVWRCVDDEWVTRLGGVPSLVVDPTAPPELDHRHLRAFGAGATISHVDLGDVGASIADEREWAPTILRTDLR